MESSGEEQTQQQEHQERLQEKEEEEEKEEKEEDQEEDQEEDDEEEDEEDQSEGLHLIFKVELDGEIRRCRLILNETVTAEGVTALICQLFHLPVGTLHLRFRDDRDECMRSFLSETWNLAIDCARDNGGLLRLDATLVETNINAGEWEVFDEATHGVVEAPPTRTLSDWAAQAAQAYKDSAPLRAQFMSDLEVAKTTLSGLSEDGGRMLWQFGSMVGAAAGRQAANFAKRQSAGRSGGLWSSSAAALSGGLSSGSQSAAPAAGISLGPQPRSQQLQEQERRARILQNQQQQQQQQQRQQRKPQATAPPEPEVDTRQLRMEEEQRQHDATYQRHFQQQQQKQLLKEQKAAEKAERKAMRRAQREMRGPSPEDTLCLDEYEHVLGDDDVRPSRTSKLPKATKKLEAASSPSMSPTGTCRSEDSMPEVVVPCPKGSPRSDCRSLRSMTEDTTYSSLRCSSSDSLPQDFELAWHSNDH